jgi:hypothetical protein
MSGGYDTASTVATGWASAASNGYGTPTFWMRYFSPCYTTPFNTSTTSANDECSSIWDINSASPMLSPITVPTQSRLAGSTAEGQADAQAFVSALTTVYFNVIPLQLPTNNQLYVWLDQEEAYGLSLDYWNGWAGYIGLDDFGNSGTQPLYPCLYCTPDAAAANCSTIQNSGVTFPCIGVWSSEWQECSNSLAHPPSWNAQSCSEVLTLLWQFSDGTGICNNSDVDQDLNRSGFSLADFSFYLTSHP